ncbi:hypothetical protein ACOSP7_020482 [Xanthoceras sorbifolium]
MSRWGSCRAGALLRDGWCKASELGAGDAVLDGASEVGVVDAGGTMRDGVVRCWSKWWSDAEASGGRLFEREERGVAVGAAGGRKKMKCS